MSKDGLTTVQAYLDQKYGKENIEFVQNGTHTNMLATVFGSLCILGLVGGHKKKKDKEN